MSKTSQYIFQKLNTHESGYYFIFDENNVLVECLFISYGEKDVEASVFQTIGDEHFYSIVDLPQLIKENYSMIHASKAIIQP